MGDPPKCKGKYRLYHLGHLADHPSINCGHLTNQVTTINHPQGHLTDQLTNLLGHSISQVSTIICPQGHSSGHPTIFTRHLTSWVTSTQACLCPAMHIGEMTVEILHPGKCMACRRTTSDPAIERFLKIRVIHTNWPVFQHTLFDRVHLTTVRAPKTLIQLRSVNTILGPLVLPHTLGTGILLTTVWTSHLITLNTGRSVPPPYFLTSQHLTTLITWVLLPSMHPHVYHQPVVCYKGLLTHRTVLGFPRNCRNLVWHFGNLPGLSTLREVPPTKKS